MGSKGLPYSFPEGDGDTEGDGVWLKLLPESWLFSLPEDMGLWVSKMLFSVIFRDVSKLQSADLS